MRLFKDKSAVFMAAGLRGSTKERNFLWDTGGTFQASQIAKLRL